MTVGAGSSCSMGRHAGRVCCRRRGNLQGPANADGSALPADRDWSCVVSFTDFAAAVHKRVHAIDKAAVAAYMKQVQLFRADALLVIYS